MYYDSGRIHQSLHVTPAMEAYVARHIRTLEEIAGLVPAPTPAKRGAKKKTQSEI